MKNISIIIATYNSEKTLSQALNSIKKQTYPQSNIEVLVIDGGSSDRTLKIAKKFHCRIIPNPLKQPVPAKHLGILAAKGRYVMFLDSDEVIENPDCLVNRLNIFSSYPKVKTVIGTGYKNPPHYPFINAYINEFGDPFSFFIYRLSKDARFYLQTMKQKYPIVVDNSKYTIFNLNDVKVLPITELIAMATMVDLQYLKKTFPEIKKNLSLTAHLFYLINKKKGYIAITKNDAVFHYSSEGLNNYLGKISSRVKNNIHHVSSLGESAYTGREKFQPEYIQYKRYFFIPYALLLIPSLIDALWLSLTRRNFSYLIHVFLCFYTAIIIIIQYSLKLLGNKPKLRSYGDKDLVDLN
jgi:glycosyltransferase involved in cell wall biosynthesis